MHQSTQRLRHTSCTVKNRSGIHVPAFIDSCLYEFAVAVIFVFKAQNFTYTADNKRDNKLSKTFL